VLFIPSNHTSHIAAGGCIRPRTSGNRLRRSRPDEEKKRNGTGKKNRSRPTSTHTFFTTPCAVRLRWLHIKRYYIIYIYIYICTCILHTADTFYFLLTCRPTRRTPTILRLTADDASTHTHAQRCCKKEKKMFRILFK